METYYDILRITPKASELEIKKSFLSLVSKYHPDIYEGDKIFAQNYTAKLNEAYSTLKDPALREAYDKSNKIKSSRIKDKNRPFRNTQTSNGAPPFVILKNVSQSNSSTIEQSRKKLRNTQMRRDSVLKRVFTSKLFYVLVIIFGLEVAVLIVLLNLGYIQ